MFVFGTKSDLDLAARMPIFIGMIRAALRTISLIYLAVAPFAAAAQDTVSERWEADRTQVFDAAEIDLGTFVWMARPVVVFADSPNDPQFRHQMELFAEHPEDLAERDVIIITDTSPSDRSEVRQKLRPRGFHLVLIDKDGRVALRKPAPWSLRELSRSIDKSPLRQQEIEDRRSIN